MTGRRVRLGLLALGGLALAAGIAAPFLNANRFASRIRPALERALGRKVELGNIHLRLLPVPGLTVSDVVIHEDPAYGREPVAYVTRLVARPKVWSLWTGKLEFASLRLEEPSLNLVRAEGPGGAVRWNFEPLVVLAGQTALPELSIRDGRLNFKFGHAKSLFYLMAASVDLSPPAGGAAAWRIRFQGEPARTDRQARGFGRLEGEGSWKPGGELQAYLLLDRSALADLSALVAGRDIGIHGRCSSRVRLRGPLDAIRLTGSLNLEEIHRWDLMPPYGGALSLALEGRLDGVSQWLQVDARPAEEGPAPFEVRFRASEYLSKPRWAVGLTSRGLDARPLVELARHLGVPLPAQVSVTGTVQGAGIYSGGGGVQGRFGLQGASVRAGDAPAIEFEQAEVVLEGSRMELTPAVASSVDEEARIQGTYDWSRDAIEVSVNAGSMRIASPASRAALGAVPLLEKAKSGIWQGRLRYQRAGDAPGLWSGRIQVRDAEVAVPGLSEAVRLDSANAQVQGTRLVVDHIRGRAGSIAWTGEYRYEPQRARPDRFHFVADEADSAELERLLLPTLRRGRGFLSRTFGFGRAPAPEWLAGRHAAGTVEIGALRLGDWKVERLHARVVWDGAGVEFDDLGGHLAGGEMKGRLAVNLRGRAPAYRLTVEEASAGWKNGRLKASAIVETAGLGSQLLENLRSEGRFEGRSLELEPTVDIERLSGSYRLRWGPLGPRLEFPDLELVTGDLHYTGKGATQEDGQLLLTFIHEGRQLRLSGTLAQLHADRTEVSGP